MEDSMFEFLKYKGEYVKENGDYNLVLLVDGRDLCVRDINGLYIKMKKFNVKVNIKVGMRVEGVIEERE
ncbi:hypothetical protein [Staphylococcus saprophyticus]|uniref:hypothetical protein n=1 Tax=Staphylococcus saprophyticus TaxID=29385 RepID=UPI00119E3299|nr:hypothetical protein [Staphylococcus saprophyticus]